MRYTRVILYNVYAVFAIEFGTHAIQETEEKNNLFGLLTSKNTNLTFKIQCKCIQEFNANELNITETVRWVR